MTQPRKAGDGPIGANGGANRRDFLKTSAAAASAAWWVGGTAFGFQDSKNPMERLNFACIGVDGKGSSDTDDAGRFGNIVGLCDINERNIEKKASRFPNAKKFVDFREMLDQLGDEVDAITVSTPDHTHATAASLGLSTGKHVFCQKPLTWSVNESRVLRALFEQQKKNGVCTQMGNQGTATTGLREGVELIRSGMLGDVTEVHVWTNRPIWPQGEGRPQETAEPPKYVHWDLFLGPAAERPYNPTAYIPFKWRGWVDFGTGALGDMACHTCNLPVMALSLFDAESVVAESSGIVENEQYPKASKIVFQFPERQGMDGKTYPACTLYWYDGGNKPDPSLLLGEPLNASGMLAIGKEGRLYSPHDYGAEWTLLPKKNFENYKKPEAVLPRSPGHFEEFANACRARKPEMAMSNFDYATRLTDTILFGNVAMLAGEKVTVDRKTGKITAPESANKLLGREYREGWKLYGDVQV